jgi:hypothetical protein
MVIVFSLYYTNCMAVAIITCGRPRVMADIDFDNALKRTFIDDFQSGCDTFHYREMMALSRTLGVTPVTVANWKYRIYFPRFDIAADVLDWVQRGKPIKLVPPSQSGVGRYMP